MKAFAGPPARMSARDFIVWEAGDGLRYQLIDGEPHAMAPTSTVHGLLQSELSGTIGNHLREKHPGCEVIANPGVIPRLLSAHNFRIPGLGVTCAPVRPGQASLPEPLLLVEILSPSNQADSWANVRAYTSISSVQDILVLHSTRICAELLSRNHAGAWPDQPTEWQDGVLTLPSIGFSLPIAALYARTGLEI